MKIPSYHHCLRPPRSLHWRQVLKKKDRELTAAIRRAELGYDMDKAAALREERSALRRTDS